MPKKKLKHKMLECPHCKKFLETLALCLKEFNEHVKEVELDEKSIESNG